MATTDWERHEDGSHIAIPIAICDAAEVRRWCAENCTGDFLISLNRVVVFQRREDAALATLGWRREED
jgi:hypothetical protein